MIIISHEVNWSRTILEAFIDEALLTSEEEWIMRTRLKGMSRVQQSMELGVSISALDKKIATIKQKYDRASNTSLVLPPRRKSTVLF